MVKVELEIQLTDEQNKQLKRYVADAKINTSEIVASSIITELIFAGYYDKRKDAELFED